MLATGGRDGGDGGDDGDVKTPLLLLMGSEPTVFSVIMRSDLFVPQQRLHISAKHQRDLLRREDQYSGVCQVYTLLSASINFVRQIMNATLHMSVSNSIYLYFILQAYTDHRKINILQLRGGCSSGSSGSSVS